MTESLLEQLARENAAKGHKERQAAQRQHGPGPSQPRGSQRREIVAIYAFCENGDTGPLLLARHICQRKGWWLPVEYIDYHLPGKHEPSMYNHCIADISAGLIQILVSYCSSPELIGFCGTFGCKVVQADV